MPGGKPAALPKPPQVPRMHFMNYARSNRVRVETMRTKGFAPPADEPLRSGVRRSPRHRDQAELFGARKAADDPDATYDLDGDGSVRAAAPARGCRCSTVHGNHRLRRRARTLGESEGLLHSQPLRPTEGERRQDCGRWGRP